MILSLIFLLVVAATTESRSRGRIFGGRDATAGQFPFIAALNHPNQFCDGAIINQQWIVTAAHCLDGFFFDTTVMVGSHIEHGGIEYSVNRTIMHEDYQDDGRNDVGLVKINGTFEFSDTVQPIEVGGGDVNEECVAIGWGVTSTDDFPEIAQYVELTTISLEKCKKMAEGNADDYYLGPEQVCTLADVGKGTCYGDSGGPLVCGGKLTGVVAWGVLPCALGYPDVFTRLSAYKAWIDKNIQS